MDVEGADGMVIMFDALTVRMTHCAIGGRQPHPIVSLSGLRCTATMGQRDSAFCSRIATSLMTPVSPDWY